MESKLFSIDLKDVLKGIVIAVLTGFTLPVLIALQNPGFEFATANWGAILQVGITGAVSGFSSYLIKSFFSDSEGKVLGRIG